MKFQAVIHEQQYMKEFLNTVLTLSRLTKECVTNISSDKLYFIINEESASAAPLVWTEICCATYFDEYIMEGVDEHYPNILLKFNPAYLARALSVLRGSVTFVKIKLTNKKFPCLTIDIELTSNNSVQNRRVVHHVPVNVIPRRDWSSYKFPKIPPAQVTLTMPSLRFIRNLIDKIKNLSPSITICATSSGELSIIAETDSATVASHYRNLEIKNIDRTQFENDADDDDDDAANNPAKEIEVACLIDCKKTAIFLLALPMMNLELSCGIVQDHVVHMEVGIRQGMVINCIVPAVCV